MANHLSTPLPSVFHTHTVCTERGEDKRREEELREGNRMKGINSCDVEALAKFERYSV
jgi:hypothetical protein